MLSKRIGGRKNCECKIRGVVEMYDVRKSIWYNIHPDNLFRRLRQFKYCPICGKELTNAK